MRRIAADPTFVNACRRACMLGMTMVLTDAPPIPDSRMGEDFVTRRSS
jgi:hypothetical protein